MSNTKPPLRFVPTLTEVVQPGHLSVTRTPIDGERLVEEVLQKVRPRLEQQLRAALQAQVEEHMRLAASQWRGDIEDAVRSAVAKVVKPPPSI